MAIHPVLQNALGTYEIGEIAHRLFVVPRDQHL